MDSNGILHLTVSATGQVSLWETPAKAQMHKQPNEVMVQLSLTKSQMATVLKAEMVAKKNKETKR